MRWKKEILRDAVTSTDKDITTQELIKKLEILKLEVLIDIREYFSALITVLTPDIDYSQDED